MAQIITNQASVSFSFDGRTDTALSNIASATLAEPLSALKLSVEDVYRPGAVLTYTVSIVNSSAGELIGLTVTDNLGTFAVEEAEFTPLTFVAPALLFIDGVFAGALTPTFGTHSVAFSIPSLDSESNAQIIYKAAVNEFAPLVTGSVITNTVAIDSVDLLEKIIIKDSVAVDDYADVRISKAMSPSSLVNGSTLTYTFNVYNYGNTAATSIVLSDLFDPAPDNLTVQLNGATLAPARYSYVGDTLTVPTGEGFSLSLAAANIVRDTVTGVVRVEPTSLVITAKGPL